MAGRVIQGFFIGGGLRSALAMQPKSVQSRVMPLQAARLAPGPGRNDRFEIDPATVGLAASGGAPLAPTVLAKMESAFGQSFSAVRVHVGPQAPRIGAVAFTTGNDIYFAPGRYQPATVQGQQLLGHELAHVVQQRQGRVRADGSGVYVVHDRALEAEADRLGARAAAATSIQPKRAAAPGRQPSGTIQCHPLTIKIAGYQSWTRDTSDIRIEEDLELFRQKINSRNRRVVSIEMRKKSVGDHQVVVVGTEDGRFTQFDVGTSGAILRYGPEIEPDHYPVVTGTYDPNGGLRLHDVFRAFLAQAHARGFDSINYNCVRFASDFVGRIGTLRRNRGGGASYSDMDAVNDLFG